MAIFPKDQRLTGETIIHELFVQGRSFHLYPFRVIWKKEASEGKKGSFRVLFSVPRRLIHHATDRNKIRRRCREAFRHHKHRLENFLSSQSVELSIAIVYTAKEEIPYAVLESKIQQVLVEIEKRYEKAAE